MCLGIPGKVIEIRDDATLLMGKVDFGGVRKEACLAYTPEVRLGDYVIVHVGFAISRVDEEEAQEIFSYLQQIEGLDEIDGEPAADAENASSCGASSIPTSRPSRTSTV